MANEIVVDISARLEKIEQALGQVKDTAENTGKRIEAGLNLEGLVSNFTGSLTSMALKITAVAIAAEGLKKAFDAVLEGEHVQAINAQFEILTKSVHLSSTEIREGLVGAAQGLADDTDLILAANKAISLLGSNAKEIPQVMSLAAKATAAFGGELTSNFETLSNSIASGNTRALRQLGIIIDSEKAYKDYAASIGTVASALSESGRQQAILNAVLEKGNSTLGEIDPTASRATTAFTRLKVTISESLEAIQVSISNAFGGSFKSIFDKATQIIKGFTDDLKGSFSSSVDDIPLITARIAELSNEVEKAKQKGPDFITRLFPSLANNLAQEELDRLKNKLIELQAQKEKIDSQNAATAAKAETAIVSPVDLTKIKENQDKANAILIQSQTQALQAEQQAATARKDIIRASQIQEELIITQHLEKQSAIRRQFAELGLSRSNTENSTLIQLTKTKNAQLEALQLNTAQRLAEIDLENQKRNQQAASILSQTQIQAMQAQQQTAAMQNDFARSDALQQDIILTQNLQRQEEIRNQFAALKMQGSIEETNALINLEMQKNAQIEQLRLTAARRLTEIDKIARSAVVNGLTASMSAFGAALAKGGNAMQAFSNAIIGAIGNLAIQIGSFLVAVGLGFQAAGAILPAWAVAGAGTVAAGLGLIALGGALQAMGTGGGGGGVETGGGGVSSGGVGGSASLTQQEELERQRPNSQIVVNVQGNILDRRQTGLELVEVIKEHFETNATTIGITTA